MQRQNDNQKTMIADEILYKLLSSAVGILFDRFF